MRLSFCLAIALVAVISLGGFGSEVKAGPTEEAHAALALAQLSPANRADCKCMEGGFCECRDCTCGLAQKHTVAKEEIKTRTTCPEFEWAEAAKNGVRLETPLMLAQCQGGQCQGGQCQTQSCANGTCGRSYPVQGAGEEQEEPAQGGTCQRGDGSKHPVLYRVFHPFKGRQGGGGRSRGGKCCGG